MKRNAFNKNYWRVGLAILLVLPTLGCIARPYGRSNTTTASTSGSGSNTTTFSYGANSTYGGSSSNSSNSTFPGSNNTYPSYQPGANSTYPSDTPPGNSTFPATRPSNDFLPPIRRPRDNSTYPSSSSSSRNERAVRRVPSLELRGPEFLAQPAAEAAEKPQADPRDWPYWRGPEYNGISRETGLIEDFDPEGGEGSNVRWKRDDIGSRSTPITMNGKLYTLMRDQPGTKKEGEKVICLNLDTGETIWENRFNVWLSDVPKERIAWSSVVGDPATGNVYALGVCGYFQCINGETGETIWSLPLHERFGLLSTYGGRTNFPVICEDLVIISGIVIGWGDMAKPAHRFIGFNKLTGEVVWMNGTRLLPEDTTYSAPTITVLGGQKAFVIGSGDGYIWALQPRTGRHIWHYPFSQRGLNVSPIVVGDTIYSGHSEENVAGVAMGAVVSINGAAGAGDIAKTGENWIVKELMVGKSSPIVIKDRIYCFDDRAKVHVLETKSGEPVTKRPIPLGTVMRGSPVYADGKVYAVEANGRWYIMKPDPEKGLETISKGRFTGEEINASPIVSHGKMIIQTGATLYCLEDEKQEHGLDMAPAAPVESPVGENKEPAFVQVVPAEVLTRPGAEQKFTARLFNSRGQLLGETDAEFEAVGPAKIDDAGNFVANADAAHQAVTVKAKVGDLVGESRVRVVPDLPWKFDFEGLTDPPVTFVGARYRHVIRKVDGSDVMVKVTTIPKGTRSRCWFGHTDLSNYTIQADVKGALTNAKMPDIGITAQGYSLDLQGASQKLQIRRWVAELVMAEEVDFEWKADTWYTMKLTAFVEDGKGIVRGKVWPRDEAEPDDWTIEAIDETPNRSGSPGLFGNAKDAELYLDNILVTPN